MAETTQRNFVFSGSDIAEGEQPTVEPYKEPLIKFTPDYVKKLPVVRDRSNVSVNAQNVKAEFKASENDKRIFQADIRQRLSKDQSIHGRDFSGVLLSSYASVTDPLNYSTLNHILKRNFGLTIDRNTYKLLKSNIPQSAVLTGAIDNARRASRTNITPMDIALAVNGLDSKAPKVVGEYMTAISDPYAVGQHNLNASARLFPKILRRRSGSALITTLSPALLGKSKLATRLGQYTVVKKPKTGTLVSLDQFSSLPVADIKPKKEESLEKKFNQLKNKSYIITNNNVIDPSGAQ